MTTLPFKPSEPFTLGVELELQIVNRRDYDLSRSARRICCGCSKSRGIPARSSPRSPRACSRSAPRCTTPTPTCSRSCKTLRDLVVRQADRLNLGIAGGGAHPFQRWNDRRIFPMPRFHFLSELYGYLAKQFTVFGQHIHVGCQSGDQAVRLLHGDVALYPALHRAVGLVAVPAGGGHRVRLGAIEQRECLPAVGIHAGGARAGRGSKPTSTACAGCRWWGA